MTVAINIRGTGGSGKSTLVRNLIGLYQCHANITERGRKRPMATCHWVDTVGEGKQLLDLKAPLGLFVPGHYETDCGGCDTVKTVDKVYELIRASALGDHNNVLYEGIMVMDDVTRAVKFDQDLKCKGAEKYGKEWEDVEVDYRLHVISLTTPIEECLRRIRQRRGAEKEAKTPLKEKNTRERMKRQESSLHRLKQADVTLHKLSCEEAFQVARELLGV